MATITKHACKGLYYIQANASTKKYETVPQSKQTKNIAILKTLVIQPTIGLK